MIFLILIWLYKLPPIKISDPLNLSILYYIKITRDSFLLFNIQSTYDVNALTHELKKKHQ